jgi:ABC-2 type transport system permease protein
VKSLAGTRRLIRFTLRRDRVRLPVWVLAITFAVLGSVASFADTYPTAADRQDRTEVLENPIGELFTGPGYGLENYTYGAMTANEMLPITAVVVALMSIFLVVRHTRAEEESGRAELIRSTPTGRHAPIAATLTVVGGANLVLGALLTLGLPASLDGLSTAGSLAFSAALVGIGLVFAGAAVLVAQVTVNARAALGVASTVLGFAYLVRAVGDMTDTGLVWASPFGWATEIRAYVDERWWPLLLSLSTAALLGAAAVAINARRDVDAGLLAERPGPPAASPLLASPLGLAVRLQRATLGWWSLVLLLVGLLYGGIAQEAGEQDLDALDDYLERVGQAAAADQYLALTLFISALVGIGYAIQSATRPRKEEIGLRAETVLATPVSRVRWAASHYVVALAGSVVLLAALGLGAGTARSLSEGDAGEVPRLLGAALAYAPALWVFVGLAATLYGLVPRATSAAWGTLAAVLLIGWLGPLLQLPDWIYELSPAEQVPRLPVADFSVPPLIVLTLVSAGLLAAGLAGIRRRDIVA